MTVNRITNFKFIETFHMLRLTKTILLLLLLFSYGSLFAQKHMVTGKVIDPRTGNGLGGASIKIKGSTVGVSSNNDCIFAWRQRPAIYWKSR